MPIYKNQPGQFVDLYAWDDSTSSGNDPSKPGDAGNITVKIKVDDEDIEDSETTNPSEIDPVNMKGMYRLPLSTDEVNGNVIIIYPTSATPNILIDPIVISTTPLSSSVYKAK